MIYPIMILYALIILTAEAAKKMVKTLEVQGQARRLVKI
jgi:hypothetical protein